MRILPPKAVIACVHLLSTPGSPGYDGDVARIYDAALSDTEILLRNGADAVIVENFRDRPFYPDVVPAETTATVAAVTREVVRQADVPVGVAVLRNDASAAMAIAVATQASFIRVNVHAGAVLAEQGVVTGRCHDTLRLRQALRGQVAVFADVGVKHSRPLVYPDLATEIRDLSTLADGVIVSGDVTGVATNVGDLAAARAATKGTVLVGSGVTPENLAEVFTNADGFIVGSYFKRDSIAGNPVDEDRVCAFMDRVRSLRARPALSGRASTTG